MTKFIVRANEAGVFFGEIISRNGNEVEMTNCRRIWYWSGAASISQLAMEGTSEAHNCKFTIPVNKITIFNVIEIIECTDKAVNSINSVKEWKK